MPPDHSPAADDLALGIAGRAQPFALAGRETLLVGRGTQADIRFPQDTGCSREQLRLVRRGGGWWVEPLSGSIATLVNGRAIGEPVPLSPGDQLAGVIVPDLPWIPDLIAQTAISGFWTYDGMMAVLADGMGDALGALSMLAAHFVAFMGAALGILVFRDRRGR
ncbi:MAG: FHA domain-containing protein [Alphaproteobacteria bacterium]|jgi:hypothetical protein|nr:FHA domain-containing protein [Alphaproteobacteria bacterium]